MIYDFIKSCNFNENSIIFELGAHMGFDTEKLYQASNKAKVYAFEPDPRNINILNNRGINNIATIINMAVSNKTSENENFYLSEGEMPVKTGNDYYDNNDWSASSSLRMPKLHDEIFPWCKITNKININTITLNDFCIKNNIKNIDFIWMDVQGSEHMVFEGAKSILSKIRYIYTEVASSELYKGQILANQVTDYLPGFRVLEAFQGDVLLVNDSFHSISQ